VNLGNTCYVNGVLQILFYCPNFRENLRSLGSDDLIGKKYRQLLIENSGKNTRQKRKNNNENLKISLVDNLICLYDAMEEDRVQKIEQIEKTVGGKKPLWFSKTANPTDFIESTGSLNKLFSKTGQQQDVQEFLRFLLGYLQDFETEKNKNSAPILPDLEKCSQLAAKPEKSKKISLETIGGKNTRKRKINELIEISQNCFNSQKSNKKRKTRNSQSSMESGELVDQLIKSVVEKQRSKKIPENMSEKISGNARMFFLNMDFFTENCLG